MNENDKKFCFLNEIFNRIILETKNKSINYKYYKIAEYNAFISKTFKIY